MKKKKVAGILALLLGTFGLHRFYLGQRFKGVLYLIAFGIGIIATAESGGGAPMFLLVTLAGFINAILFFVMPTEEFDKKYNPDYYYDEDYEARPRARFRREPRQHVRRERRQRQTPTRQPQHAQRPRPLTNSFKVSGLEKYQDYDILGAMEDLRKALNANFKDSSVHFYLACCYSINEEPEKALFHLDKSVDFGFVDFDKIHNYDALAFLRTHNRFEEFVKNSYQIPRYLPPEEDAQLNTMEDEKAMDLLDQIAQLGALYEKGVLTPEEFQLQKQKLFLDESN